MCDKCAKVGRPCPYCKMADIVPAGEAKKAVNQCVNHPGIRAAAACANCERIFCASCLNQYGQCLPCGHKFPKSKPTVATQAEVEAAKVGRKFKPRPKRGHFQSGSRLVIGAIVLGAIGTAAYFQYDLIKRSMPAKKKGSVSIAGNIDAYKKQVDAHGKDLDDIMGRIEANKYSPEDEAALENLMANIESGKQDLKTFDQATLDRLEKARAMVEVGGAKRGGVGESGDDGYSLPGAEPARGGKPYQGPAIRLRVGEGRPQGETAGNRYAMARQQPVYRPKPLKVAMTSPGSGARLSGNAVISANVTGDGIDRVEFQVNGQWQGVSNQPPFRFDWDTSGTRNGPVTLRVVAYDSAGKPHSSRAVRVTVQN
jgi:hypothetical protein